MKDNPIPEKGNVSKREGLHEKKSTKSKPLKLNKKKRRTEGYQEVFIDEPFFGKIPEQLLKDTDVSLQAKCIYAIYHLHANQKRLDNGSYSFPSQKRTAGDFANISVSYLKKLVSELRTKGWITSINLGLGRPNIIVLHKEKNEKINSVTCNLYINIVKTRWRENSGRILYGTPRGTP